jgi:hypothetical protein
VSTPSFMQRAHISGAIFLRVAIRHPHPHLSAGLKYFAFGPSLRLVPIVVLAFVTQCYVTIISPPPFAAQSTMAPLP